MLTHHAILDAAERPAACVRLTIPRPEIKAHFGPAVSEVLAALRAEDLVPVGPLFAHHLDLSDDSFDFLVGFPISATASFTPTGRVTRATQPGGTMARAIYTGPYEGLPAAWQTFASWVDTQCTTAGPALGKRRAKHILEVYLSGPESTPDSTLWQTQLSWPLE